MLRFIKRLKLLVPLTAEQAITAREDNAALRRALEDIADLPDPGAEQERTATFYRIHIAMLKQIAAKGLGRQIVSQEAFDWAEEWFNSPEGITASEVGKLGNAVKRERARARHIRFHDEMRARLGLPPTEWKQ